MKSLRELEVEAYLAGAITVAEICATYEEALLAEKCYTQNSKRRRKT